MVIFLKVQISEASSDKLEAVVGVMLIFLGLNAFASFLRPKRVHIHTHEHGDAGHVHIHTTATNRTVASSIQSAFRRYRDGPRPCRKRGTNAADRADNTVAGASHCSI